MSENTEGCTPDLAATVDCGSSNWPAVLSMTLGVFGLAAAEFLPAGLLTPIASDLGTTQGLAGQAITTTAAVAVLAGLLAPTLTRSVNRRVVLLAFSILVIASNLLVASASHIAMLFFGRVFLGIALGGFWTIATATIMRLASERMVPRAVTVMYSGTSIATVVAVPLGSYFESFFGWRSVFLIAAGLSALGLIAQLVTLPKVEPRGHTRLRSLVEVLARPHIACGMIVVVLVFGGHFTFFPYIRPFIEGAISADVNTMSVILLGFGLTSFLGTYLACFVLERNVELVLVAPPLVMGILGLLFVGADTMPAFDGAMILLWGLAFGAIPGSWTTWAVRAVPDEAENANGLIVAAIGTAQAIGAGLGGVLFDASGIIGVFIASSVLALTAVSLVLSNKLGQISR